MASVTVTWTAGQEAGAGMRRLARQIEKAAGIVPDRNPTGASVVLTIDNTLGSHAGVTVTQAGGPSNSATFVV